MVRKPGSSPLTRGRDRPNRMAVSCCLAPPPWEDSGSVDAVDCASVRAAPPWQAWPEAPWQAGRLPHQKSHKYLLHQVVASTTPSLPTALFKTGLHFWLLPAAPPGSSKRLPPP